MRPYATISPLFWAGATGKRLRSNPDAQRVALKALKWLSKEGFCRCDEEDAA